MARIPSRHSHFSHRISVAPYRQRRLFPQTFPGLLRIGAGPRQVVLVAGVEATEVQFVIDQVVQGMFKGAGLQLPFKVDGNEARTGVDVLVAGHGIGSKRDAGMTLVIPFGSQQNARMKRAFLQLRYASPSHRNS